MSGKDFNFDDDDFLSSDSDNGMSGALEDSDSDFIADYEPTDDAKVASGGNAATGTQRYTESLERAALSHDGTPNADHKHADFSPVLPTVIGNEPADDLEYTVSMGRMNASMENDGAGFAVADSGRGDSRGPKTHPVGPEQAQANLSSRIWNTSAVAGGLSSSLVVRQRPISGQLPPFHVQDDADYEVLRKLASGGMGDVYIARQTSLNRELALKTLKPLTDKEREEQKSGRLSQRMRLQREGFLSEALVTANLVHPNIVPIHDLCQTEEGVPFYSMKLVNGEPWVRPSGSGGKSSRDFSADPIRTMSLGSNLEILLKICDGVAYAHSKGVVNRDLKPENVIIGDYGEVVILDWGLAVPTPDAEHMKFSTPMVSHGAGTPAYMAPELWTGPADRIGRWSDIYLLGAMLFEIITGYPPHRFDKVGDTPVNPSPSERQRLKFQVIDTVVGRNEIRQTKHRGELFDIAMKAMKTDPDDRHKSVQEFQAAIREYLRHEESRVLTSRANQLMQGKSGTKFEGYEDYQTAAALYNEAIRGWDGNDQAAEGLSATKLKYAEVAYNRGDFDLGLQLVEGRDEPEFKTVRAKLEAGKKKRDRTKWTIRALLATVVFGTAGFSIYALNQSTVLQEAYGTAEDAKSAAVAAEKQKADALIEKGNAETLAKQAADKQVLAENAAVTADRKVTEAEELVKTAQANAVAADMLAKSAQAKVSEANEKVETAKKEQLAAETKKTEAEMKQAEAVKLAAEANQKAEEALRLQKLATVEVKGQEIISLTQTSDFAGAIKAIDALLNGEELSSLGEKVQQQRRAELTAQKEQLQQLSTQTASPVRAQRMSADGTLVAWIYGATGGEPGSISIHKVAADSGRPNPEPIAEWKLPEGETADVDFLNSKVLLCLERDRLTQWDIVSNDHQVIASSTANFVSMTRVNEQIVTADSQGRLEAWDVDGRNASRPIWQHAAETDVRDLLYLPVQKLLVYAGSRGNVSADVTALRVTVGGVERLAKDGQLKFSRDTLAPPRVMAVSPVNAELLVIANSRNGSLLFLPRNTSVGGFPFESPVTLAGWQQTRHGRPVNAIAFSADGLTIATASDDRTIGIWRVEGSGTENVQVVWDQEHLLEGHGAAVTDVTFVGSTKRPMLASTSRDRYCRIWDLNQYPEYRENLKQLLRRDAPAATTTHSSAAPPKPEINTSDASQRTPVSETPDSYRKGRRRYIRTVAPADDRPYVILNSAQASGEEAVVLRGGIRSVNITNDGERVVTGGSEGAAVLWNVESGGVVRGASKKTIFNDRAELFEEGHKFNIARLQFLPDPSGTANTSQICLSSSYDGSLCLWQANPAERDFGAEKNRITNLRLINAAATSPDGRFIVTSSLGNESNEGQKNHPCVRWNTDELLKGVIPVPESTVQFNGFHRDIVTCIAVSGDGRRVATGAKDGFVAVWNSETGQIISSVLAHDEKTLVTDLAWLGNDELLTTGVDGHIRQWQHSDETRRISRILSYKGAKRSPVNSLSVSPQQEQFVTIHATFQTGSDQPVYELRRWKTGTPEGTSVPLAISDSATATSGSPGAGLVSSAAWSTDGNTIAVVAGGQINFLNTQTWQVERLLKSKTGDVSAAIFVPHTDNQRMATFDGASTQVWDLKDGRQVITFRPQQTVQVSALTHDQQHQFLATADDSVQIYDSLESSAGYGQTICKIPYPHIGGVTSLAFDQNDKQLVTGGRDGSLKIWDWHSDEKTLTAHSTHDFRSDFATNSVVDVDWSQDGTDMLVVTSRQAAIFTPATGKIVPLVLSEDSSGELLQWQCGAMRHDDRGTVIVIGGLSEETGGSLGVLFGKTRDSEKYEQTATFAGHGAGGVSCVRFVSQHGSPYLVSGGSDGAAIVWNWTAETPYQAYRFMQPRLFGAAHRASITDIAVSAMGRIVTCSDDGTAIVWKNPLSMPSLPRAL